MEYTELADYQVPTGAITAWEATADPDSWCADSRRLSYMHLEHARRAAELGDEWHGHWIGTAFTIEERFDRDAFAATIRQWFARHEALRSAVQLGGTPEDDLVRMTIEPEAVGVSGLSMGVAASPDAARQRIQDFFDTTVNPLTWPHCVVVTLEPDDRDDRFLVVFGADHTVMDAYTQVFAINELSALYRAEINDEHHGLAEYGSYLDFSDAERHLGEQIDANNSAVVAWRQFFNESPTSVQPHAMPRFPRCVTGGLDAVVPPREPDSGMQVSLSRDLLDSAQAARFNDICKAAGGSVTTGIYTAMSIASAALAGTGEVRFVSPVHTRTGPEWGEAVGWFVGLVPVHLDPSDAQTFSQALPRVAESVSRYKNVGTAPFAPIADLIGGDVTPPGFVVSYIDLRRAQGAAEWDRRNARVLRSATREVDEVYLWINRIPDGINISTRYPSGERRREVEAFLSVFAEVLRTIVDAGDHDYMFAREMTSQASADITA